MKKAAMRTWILVLFFSGLFAARAMASVQTEQWEKADEFYQKGQYEQAIGAYQALLKESPENPYLHYNLANAYLKGANNASLGRAIAEYCRAYQLLPRDPDIRYNLEFALGRS